MFNHASYRIYCLCNLNFHGRQIFTLQYLQSVAMWKFTTRKYRVTLRFRYNKNYSTNVIIYVKRPHKRSTTTKLIHSIYVTQINCKSIGTLHQKNETRHEKREWNTTRYDLRSEIVHDRLRRHSWRVNIEKVGETILYIPS